VSAKPECPLLAEVYLKTHKNTPILEKVFLIENVMCTRNVMQCAYKCRVFTELLNRSITSLQEGG
jgi:hypothetical protein